MDHQSKKDMWLKISISLTERSKERGSLTSRTRDMQNHEIILVIGSRKNLGRQIQEVNVVDHVRKDRWKTTSAMTHGTIRQ
jgi:hypothetical protein